MKNGHIALWLILMLGLSIMSGCSGEKSSWLAPTEEPLGNQCSHTCWGLWQLTADMHNKTLDATPLRGPDMHINALVFLEPPPLVNLTLESLVFNGNIIEADIGLKHPFLGLTEFTGFDVCGVLITNGSLTGFEDPDIRMAAFGDVRLLNPDGYTRWWNPAEFPVNNGTMFSYKDGLLGTPYSTAGYNSTINAYKLFCDELTDPDCSVSVMNPESRCVFSAGHKNIRHYTIKLGPGVLVFNYAVDACWIFPEGTPPWQAPDDFPPDANRPEAWYAEVTETENTLWNNGSNKGGKLSLQIELWDHFNADSNMVYVESPGNFTPIGPVTPTDGGKGYSTYEIDIPSATPAANSIDVLITAECEETGYQGLLPGKTVAAYFTHAAKVSDKPFPIAGELAPAGECPDMLCAEHIITIGISEAYDPGGADVTVTWDFDGNLDFADDLDGDNTNLTGDYMYSTPGDYEVWCRVDNGINHVDVGPLHISTVDCTPSSPVVSNVVTFGDNTGYNVACSGTGYAYVTHGGTVSSPAGLYIFKVEPIDEAAEVNFVSVGHLDALAYKDGYCYVGGPYPVGIHGIDVDPPEEAHLVHSEPGLLQNGWIYEMVTYGDYLYVAAQWAFMIYDISDPEDPVLLGKLPTPNYEIILGIDVSPKKAYAFISWGYEVNPDMTDYFHVVDISDPTDPKIVHSIVMPHNPHSIIVDGDYAYLTESEITPLFSEWRLHIIDIADPPNAYEKAVLPIDTTPEVGCIPYDLTKDGNYIYVVDDEVWHSSGKMYVIDVKDPGAPSLYTTIGISRHGMSIVDHCGVAYATGRGWDGGVSLNIIELY